MNYFTLYFLNGDRRVVKGESIEQAFTNGGYGNGAIRTLDWYDNGVTDSHTFEGKGIWVKKQSLKLSEKDFNKENTPENIQNLMLKLKTHGCIEVSFDNKDILYIQDSYSQFSIGTVRVLTIVFGEYFPYPYHEDSDSTEHWMASQSEYFDPANPETAIRAFLARINSSPFESSGFPNADLKMLYATQEI